MLHNYLYPMKILMVCLGNICRSPMAEGVMKKILSESNSMTQDWHVDSAGIGSWHEGELPDRRAIRTAHSHGLDISDQRARQIKQADFDYFDHILVMDLENYKDALSLCSGADQKKKINLLLDFKYPGQQKMVPDPYYTDRFEESYQLILEGCLAFVQSHRK